MHLDVDALVQRIYEAADDEGGLCPLAAHLVECFDSNRLHMMLLDEQLSPVIQGWNAIDLHRNEDEDILEYNEHWKTRDPRFKIALEKPDLVHSDVYVLEQHAFEQSVFYNEFMRGIRQRHSLFSTTRVHGGHRLGFAFMRPRERGHYQPDACDLATQLIPHLARSMRLHTLYEAARHRSDQLERAFDHLPIHVALLDEHGRVVFLNAGARSLLDANEGLTWRGSRLSALHPQDGSLLDTAIREVAHYVGTAHQGSPGAAPARSLRVLRSDGSHSLVSLLPLLPSSPWRLEAPQARVLCILNDPSRPTKLHLGRLRGIFGLTPAEAELVNALFEGKTLGDFALERGTSIETVRTQMKQVFRKTDTSSQVDLVRNLALVSALRIHP